MSGGAGEIWAGFARRSLSLTRRPHRISGCADIDERAYRTSGERASAIESTVGSVWSGLCNSA